MLYGVDIASHQGYPDMSMLRAEGHSFLITKVTGEQNYVNPFWATNHDRARAAGMVPGTYDWVEPQNAGWQSGAEAARDYYRVVGARDYGSLLTVDFETPEWADGPLGRSIEHWMREYLYTLREISRKRVIVYTAPYFLKETGAERWDWLGQDFDYWLARPGEEDDAPWPDTGGKPWSVVTLHQHQWFGSSQAIRGNYDRDRYPGDMVNLRALAGVATTEGEVKEPQPGKWTSYVNEQGSAVFVWNMGGQTTENGILGVAAVDLGMTVQSATDPDTQVSRSITGGVVGDFHESPKPQP